ncbi:MAG: hypothetical protein Q4F05_16370 [bacterium]|nr:hypothetical protein [bacterium]
MKIASLLLLLKLLLAVILLGYIQYKLSTLHKFRYIIPILLFSFSVIVCVDQSGLIKENYIVTIEDGTKYSFNTNEKALKKTDELKREGIGYNYTIPQNTSESIPPILLYFVSINLGTVILLLINYYTDKVNRTKIEEDMMMLQDF